MILIGLGSNVPGPWGQPHQTIEKALEQLNHGPCKLLDVSTLIKTAPFGKTDQPDFVNAVASISSQLSPNDLMQHLHKIELSADRRRTVRWGPRTLDLDLLDYNGLILQGEGEAQGHQKPLTLPHPGIPERLFVLEPIAEIAPNWTHPVTDKTVASLIASLKMP